ncbi:hypothetical protein NLM59_07280 [Weeksellaceae bacterium KMM 9724]|uniref:hypothetical protein n=1 Tax=Profundicola chukchiensis TaxID=2961959 RepID=UPI00243CE6B8|nr:hypothetical protein [Profundicola chukchiensis]MDG4950722.1 hypothetical protein [Profundicola chukchiensis]
MKKVLLLSVVLFLSSFVFSQHKDEFGYDYKLKNGYKIFTPTWNNIFNSVSMPSHIFEELMTLYNYKYNNNFESYVLQNPTGQGIYTVKQDNKGMTFAWSGAILKANDLREIINKYFVSTINGVDNYVVNTGNEGRVIINIKDKNSDAGFVIFRVE